MILYFDCFSGISGDMALGALLDCGVPLDELRAGLASLPVEGWDIATQPALISGIHALDVTITEHGVSDAEELEHAHDHSHDHSHGHEHGHDHHDHHHHVDHVDHDQHHPTTTLSPHNPTTSPPHHHHHGRSMAEIRAIINASALSAKVKATSLAIFEKIAVAEAQMHHTTVDEVHFHEIGGIDSLIDICGVAWCLEYLGVSEVHCSALPLSSGFVQCAHGLMPIPAPATVKILQGVPMVPTDIVGELVTPTGAAIVATLAQSFGTAPAFTVRASGHGAGKKRFASRPNFLRVMLGDTASSSDGLEWRSLRVVECNVDDMNPELFDAVMTSLFAAGALDVWLQPAQMKKNRPATVLHALCAPEQQAAVLKTLLRETTTLGARVSEVRRAALPRDVDEVETPFGTVRVKVASWPEENLRRAMPEYDDVAQLATQCGVPAREVYAAAQHAAQSKQRA